MCAKRQKFLRILSLAAFGVLSLHGTATATPTGDALQIVFPDVTWGDAVLYRGPCGEVGLIDTSWKETNLRLITERIRSLGATELAWIVVSHYDRDHIAYAKAIGQSFSAPIVYDRGGRPRGKVSDTFNIYVRWLGKAGAPERHALAPGDRFSLCGSSTPVWFEVIAVNGNTGSDGGLKVLKENDRSICLKVTYRQFDMASCGDISGRVESAVAPLIGEVELVKVSHHGSSSSSSSTYVSDLKAEAALIQGPQRHDCQPDPKVIERWEGAPPDNGFVFVTAYGGTLTWGKGCRDGLEIPIDGEVTVRTQGLTNFTVSAAGSGRNETIAIDGAAPSTQERGSVMGASGVLDIVIGVIFVFLVFSLVVSGVGEVINQMLALRSRHLWRSLRKLMDEGEPSAVKDQRPLKETAPTTRVEQLYAHPLIQQLERRVVTDRSRISRIPPTDFARALVDVLVPEAGTDVDVDSIAASVTSLPVDSPLRAPLIAVLRESGEEVTRFRAAVGDWFDARMEFLSAAYKQHVRWILLGVAVLVVGIFNVDAIGAAHAFQRDEALRTAVAEQAVALTSTCGEKPDTEVTACIQDEVDKVTPSIRLPVGWPDRDGVDLWQVLGWAIAAVAISQGAPFWFDVLRKATGLRKSVDGES
jgi:beta-lactamase superfamily II metal-dependent hydrolase